MSDPFYGGIRNYEKMAKKSLFHDLIHIFHRYLQLYEL